MDEIFNDRRVKPRPHPDNQMVGDPHYLDPRTVTWVEREPSLPFRGLKSPRWRVQHLRANDQGGSMQSATGPLRRRREALEAFEQVKGGSSIYDAESTIIQQRRDAARERRERRQYERFKGYNQAVNPGSFG